MILLQSGTLFFLPFLRGSPKLGLWGRIPNSSCFSSSLEKFPADFSVCIILSRKVSCLLFMISEFLTVRGTQLVKCQHSILSILVKSEDTFRSVGAPTLHFFSSLSVSISLSLFLSLVNCIILLNKRYKSSCHEYLTQVQDAMGRRQSENMQVLGEAFGIKGHTVLEYRL